MKKLGELTASEQARAGGKARSLDALARADFPVPPGLVLFPEDLSRLDVLVPEILAFASALAARGYDRLAVRSSASLEDGVTASFAGMFESVLGVSGEAAVREAVRVCVDSSRGDRVREYCRRNGLDPADLAMSIVVQAMVEGDVSGVLFTVNPVTGADTQMVIEAVPGTGEKLVQGLVTPERSIADWYADTVSSGGPLLGDAEVRELATLALEVQRHYGSPQDIEWTRRGGEFFLLQSRPITRIRFASDQDWTNANMKDGGVASSVANPFIASMYRMMVNITMPTYFRSIRMLPAGTPPDWIGVFGSNIYWSLSSAKACVRSLPGYIEREFDEGLGIEPDYGGPGEVTPLTPKTMLKGLQVLFALKASLRRRFEENRKVFKATDDAYAMIESGDYRRLSDADLARRGVELVERDWVAIEGGYFYHIYDNSNCRTLFMKELDAYNRKARKRGRPPANYLRLVAALDAIPHLDPLNELWDIARAIEKTPGRRESLLLAYVNRYRYHSHRELDLLVPCWGEDPAQVYEALEGMLASGGDRDPRAGAVRSRAAYEEERSAVTSRGLLASLDLHRKFLRTREELRICSVKGLYVIRLFFLEVGRRLAARGAIERADEVFFLSYREACEFLGAGGEPAEVRARVGRNRAYYESFRNFAKPNEIRRPRAGGPPPTTASAENALQGVGCSPGAIEAPVYVARDVRDMERFPPGAILVTAFVDPAWTVSLLNVAGLVTEAGGILSHGAVITREYGIPSVLSVPGALGRLRTGMRIRLDGDRGTIEVLAPETEKR